MMHQAEDILMATWCVIPYYYYNDVYMQKDYVSGIYSEKTGKSYDAYIRLEDDGNRSVYKLEFDKENK